MSKTYIIAGAGFRGFCDALELSKNSEKIIYIIEATPFFRRDIYFDSKNLPELVM